MNSQIIFNNVSVTGVNTKARAHSIKAILLTRKSPIAAKIPILTDMSFTINPGDRIGIVGRNGSGKSSILKVIAGIYPPSNGHITRIGKIAPLIEMGVGFDPELTGRTNIKLSYIYSNRLSEFNTEAEERIVEFSGLRDKIDVPLKLYSSGMQARLAFSCSIFQKPDILLLDEVFATGDKEFVEKSRQLMISLFDQVPIIIMVNHNTDLIKQLCNRAFYVENGRLVEDGDPVAIINSYEAHIHS